jgi:hypothetical protein
MPASQLLTRTEVPTIATGMRMNLGRGSGGTIGIAQSMNLAPPFTLGVQHIDRASQIDRLP